MRFALNERLNRHLGQVQTLYFTWAESNANCEKYAMFSLISIRFGSCKVRRPNLALRTWCFISPLPQRRSNENLALTRDRSFKGFPPCYFHCGQSWEEKTCLIKIGLDKLIQFCTGPSSIKQLSSTRNSRPVVVLCCIKNQTNQICTFLSFKLAFSILNNYKSSLCNFAFVLPWNKKLAICS